MSKKAYLFRLRTLNFRFLITTVFLCIALGFSTFQLVNQFSKYKYSTDLYSDVSQTSMTLQDGSDYLTDEARFFVLTKDITHLYNYFYEINENKRRELAIEELAALHPIEAVLDKLNGALEQSHQLEELEYYAMALIVDAEKLDKDPFNNIPLEIKMVELTPEDAILTDEYKTAKAWLIMFSDEYMIQKRQITELKQEAIDQIFDYTEKSHGNSYTRLIELFIRMIVIIILILLCTILLYICILYLVISPLNSNINQIRAGTKLSLSNTIEFNILTQTYNEMFEKNEANEILLRHKAEHDELTGLINRSAYTQILNALKNTKIILILIDVDFFKQINDKFGHPVGDKVLQKVSSVLQENFRNNDYVARIGGDEFAVVMTDITDEKIISATISKKMTQIQKSLITQTDDIPAVTLSCGIEIGTEGYTETVYEHADAALYEVKRSGRSGYKFY